ncbi:MAG: SUMF1/EgtB/PvdO family nonheme iron enzyme [Akkermansiaceae bacterium]|nr:SUMF1/EgtB/PvdO family nonheme iron enzyme [Akkermansiaceae bacterium]
MKIECPHCGQHIALDNNAPLAFKCPTCSGHIELLVEGVKPEPPSTPTPEQKVTATRHRHRDEGRASEEKQTDSQKYPVVKEAVPSATARSGRPKKRTGRGAKRKVTLPRGLTLSIILSIFCLGGVIWFLVGDKSKPARNRTAPVSINDASPDKPFVNSLGMEFVPIQFDKERILFCRWETRVSDYQKFAEDQRDINEEWKNFSWRQLHQTADHPVVMVSKEDAEKFCAWLSEKEGLTYRLPTLFEWCVAAGEEKPTQDAPHPPRYPWRSSWPPPEGAGNFGGEEVRKYFPDGFDQYIRGWRDPFPSTAPVGSFQPNRFGIFDMFGNVGEMSSTPTGLDEKNLEQWGMGASWTSGTQFQFRSLMSGRFFETLRTGDLGFRVVLELPDDDSRPLSEKIVGKWKHTDDKVVIIDNYLKDGTWESRIIGTIDGKIRDNPEPKVNDDYALTGEYRVEGVVLHQRARIATSDTNPFSDWRTYEISIKGDTLIYIPNTPGRTGLKFKRVNR